MTIALIHPDHGTHFVYDKQELEACLKRGWKIRPDDWKKPKEQETKKRGRPRKES